MSVTNYNENHKRFLFLLKVSDSNLFKLSHWIEKVITPKLGKEICRNHHFGIEILLNIISRAKMISTPIER
jgi:hypothetical protein